MNSKQYEADYMATGKTLDELRRKRDELDAEIAKLTARHDALSTLIQDAYQHKGQLVIDGDTSPASAIVNVVQPKVTQVVKGILMAAKEPLTSAEILDMLPRFGWHLDRKSNPWALIHGIGRRLVDQQFAREVEKGGRKAWVRAAS